VDQRKIAVTIDGQAGNTFRVAVEEPVRGEIRTTENRGSPSAGLSDRMRLED
jgi:hypothetical protein